MTSVLEAEVETVGREPEAVTIEKASPGKRTLVIVLAQVVVLAAIAVVWSIMRSKRSNV